MAHLKTKYMGLELKNPLILGACNLSLDPAKAKQLEEAGIAAIVFKSLFEEQINLESLQMQEELSEYAERNAEMINLFPDMQHAGPEEHLDKLQKVKEAVGIPVIGSLNCVNRETWVAYAIEMEKTGVDGLELNFYAVPGDFDLVSDDMEASQIEILKEVKSKVKIPVSVKLSPFYANPLHLIRKFDEAGADGVVLFNRMFQPDIDLKQEQHVFPFNLSQEGDYRLSLRYAGLLYSKINADVCANTGVFGGEDVVRLILAGANGVQVVSTVYKNKVAHIGKMLSDITSWMDAHGYKNLDDFRGNLSEQKVKDPYAYKRAQYVDMLMKPFDLMKKYPQV